MDVLKAGGGKGLPPHYQFCYFCLEVRTDIPDIFFQKFDFLKKFSKSIQNSVFLKFEFWERIITKNWGQIFFGSKLQKTQRFVCFYQSALWNTKNVFSVL